MCRHKPLRATICLAAGEPRQRLAQPTLYRVDVVDILGNEPTACLAHAYALAEHAAHQPFDVSSQ